jgi:hypothetical protein
LSRIILLALWDTHINLFNASTRDGKGAVMHNFEETFMPPQLCGTSNSSNRRPAARGCLAEKEKNMEGKAGFAGWFWLARGRKLTPRAGQTGVPRRPYFDAGGKIVIDGTSGNSQRH